MNGPFTVSVLPHARRDLGRLPAATLKRIQAAIAELAVDPRNASNVKKLKAKGIVYTKRVGSFRILFKMFDTDRRIEIHRVGDRKDIYRDF